MKFKLIRTSGNSINMPEEASNEIEIEINTIEQLMSLASKYDRELIISKDTIEIYDDYRE